MGKIIPRDSDGCLHGRIVFEWEERRGPSIGGGTSAWGRRTTHRPPIITTIHLSLEAEFTHGLASKLWILHKYRNGQNESWHGTAHIGQAEDGLMIVTPIGEWLSIQDPTRSCHLSTEWKLHGHYIHENPRSNLTQRAYALATQVHKGLFCKGGDKRPFIDHLTQVAGLVRSHDLSVEAIAAAWLHRVPECSERRLDEFPGRVQAIVGLLTRRKGSESKYDALKRLAASNDLEAISIKVAQFTDDLRRGIAFLDKGWLRRYLKISYQILSIGYAAQAKGCDELAAYITNAEERLQSQGKHQ